MDTWSDKKYVSQNLATQRKSDEKNELSIKNNTK